MVDEHVLDLIAAYVLGSLSELEAAQVRRHLAVCASCQEEAQACEATWMAMVESVPQHDPPVSLRTRLIGSVSPRASSPVVTRPAPRPSFWDGLFRGRLPALAGLGLIVLLALSNFLLWRQVNLLKAQVTDTTMIVEPLYAVSAVTEETTGMLVMDPHGEYGTVIVNALKPSSEGQQYQVWLSRGVQVDSGGVFTIRKNGYGAQVIYAPEHLLLYDRVWITIEPEGGSEVPTGEIVLETQP